MARSTGTDLDRDYVAEVVRRATGLVIERLIRVPIGYGNENWLVVGDDGVERLAKFGPLNSLEKWRSAARGSELAAAAGVPTPKLLYFGTQDDHLLRIFEWVKGSNPTPSMDSAAVANLFTTLGDAVARLHSVELPSFGSRLDASAPMFGSWQEYLTYRLSQVLVRCRECDAFEEGTLRPLSEEVLRLGRLVTDVAKPTLVHRDLHADNLLIDSDGRLVSILDFDAAEAWDCAGEWFKLSWQLFPAFPGGEEHFESAYRAVHQSSERWAARRRVVDLVEAANLIANAITQGWEPAYQDLAAATSRNSSISRLRNLRGSRAR